MALLRRGIGALSRRLDKPELVSAFYAAARRDEHEAVAIRALLAGTLRRSGTYVDVGTNRGQILRDAVRLAPAGRHLAFEPIPALAAEIERDFPAVECRRLALGAEQGTAQFCYFHDLDGWSGLRRSPDISDARGRPEFIEVAVSTLDDEIGGYEPIVVKIDVEGAELDVLRGARSMLRESKPTLIIEHVASASALYGASSAEVWDLLDELSYEIYSVTGAGPIARAAFPGGADVVNWLARPVR